MITYVKIQGDSKEKALELLRKIAIAMPKICVLDSVLQEQIALGSFDSLGIPGAGGEGGNIENSIGMVTSYFGGKDSINKKRCASIISKTDIDLSENDFAYEWLETPSKEQIAKLEKDIGTILKPKMIKYTVKTV